MTTTPTPRRIEWSGPEGWTVWADEDGVHVRSARGDALEMPDVQRLLDLWSSARVAIQDDRRVPAPQPPSRDEVRTWSASRAEQYARKRAVRAIEAEFDQTIAPPF